jgi:hypothetical protein
MSGVVLRCPNCGTVQTGMDECEACHEARVRYFCTNHTPGLWLDAAFCSQCGARFGEAQRAAPSIDRRSLAHVVATSPISDDERIGHVFTPTPTFDGDVPVGTGLPTAGALFEAFAYAARQRRIRKARMDDDGAPERGSGGGCAGRLLSLALLIVAFFLLVPLLLGSALLRIF